ncbi:ATP-binding protein [Pseudochelatococcus lubricantis]|uniref:HD domain-containing protein n=1 Tax=Pseudochelatococcus lubricantis TaxID=1538102 RepID=UPI0035EFF387
MPHQYQGTGLWLRSMGSISVDSNNASQLRLLSTHNVMRDRAAVLTAQISKALPQLTIHDVTHLDALWETADLVAGPDYPLNPLEGFVLGGAILLHDAALCFEAYEGGAEGLRQTVEWKDAYEGLRKTTSGIGETQLAERADFTTLRTLHAKQAGALGTRAWTNMTGEQLHLIEDSELRQRFGPLIGDIAASHHWPVEKVLATLPPQVNAPGFLPREWRIDPVKLALLLRCADAAHIDDRRAPDFFYALARRVGISADHWKAQNWLARVDLDQSDPSRSSLLFTSNKTFGPDDVDAWWVAFDAISVLANEVASSNAALAERTLHNISPPFAVKRITGSSSPETLSAHVKVVGWKPCSAKLHVSNIENLIKSLGGENLYGVQSDKVEIALREIIQNARDAIVARRSVEPSYHGSISIGLRHEGAEVWLDVQDDGMGMSERVLTGPLLDFGSSFWASDLAREELPGLVSSSFRSIGRFGVGFYSIFMAADKVLVSSRRPDEGLAECRTLSFPNGLTMRPTLSSGRPAAFESGSSTKVSMRLLNAHSDIDNPNITADNIRSQNFVVPFGDYLAALTAGLDVDVQLSDDHGTRTVHESIQHIDTPQKRSAWLGQLSFSGSNPNADVAIDVGVYAERLRYLHDDEGAICGLAALSTHLHKDSNFLSVRSVGGLATTIHSRGSHSYVGYLDYNAQSAKRDTSAETRASASSLAKWADEQLEMLRQAGADKLTWCLAAYSLSDLHIDPTSVATALFMRQEQPEFFDLPTIMSMMASEGIAVLKSRYLDMVEMHGQFFELENYWTLKPISNGSYMSLKKEDDGSYQRNSLFDCIQREAGREGLAICVTEVRGVGRSLIGEIDALVMTLKPAAQT